MNENLRSRELCEWVVDKTSQNKQITKKSPENFSYNHKVASYKFYKRSMTISLSLINGDVIEGDEDDK
jgi:hypothetical protein